VNISTTQVIKERPFVPFPEFKGPFDDFFGDDFNKFFNQPNREFKRQSLGSGFIINKDGYILTNFHVIENATEIMVTLSEDKKDYKATVVGQDQKIDVALIKIDAGEGLPVASLGNSDDLQIGEWVVAIGNPFGLGGTVTAGIVSQKGRVIGAGPYDNFIQTDASINPGNSGGPLFNMKGQVVGINTAIIAGGQGIGFATPINMAKEVLTQLKEKGKVTRGWIGVSIQEVTPELANSFGLKETNGALISAVTPGDPADAAGLKAGDIIVSFDGKAIIEMSDLPRSVAGTAPGKTVEVRVVRDGKEKAFTVKVGTKIDEEVAAAAPEGKDASLDKRLGLSVHPVTPEAAKKFGITESDGIMVSNVRPDSPAEEAGIRRGDIIREINRKKISDVKDFNAAMDAASKADRLLLLITRGGNTMYIAITLKAQ
ncbi:MAG: DegQ family serine endoprotease, partial [Deltaproteobacteria bacterium]